VRRWLAIAVACFGLALCGCVTNNYTYDWGDYDPSLYAYYKNPAKVGQFSDSLAAIIKSGDSQGVKVPPGIYAEYGYLKLQQGKNGEAIGLFQQEEKHWPESKVFMERMIKVASVPESPPSPKGEAAR
jgi:hypothetical protein